MKQKLFVAALALLLILSTTTEAFASLPPVRPRLVPKASLVKITAFEDSNGNQRKDNGELAVSGFRVMYLSPSDKAGSCLTPRLQMFRQPGTWTFDNNGDSQWTSLACIVDGKVFAGTPALLQMTPGRHYVTFALQKKAAQPPNLYHLDVFYDQNVNGVQDAGEPMQEGVRFRATNVDTDEVFDSTEESPGSVGLVFPAGTYKLEMLAPTSIHWFNTTGNAVAYDYFPGGSSCYSIAGVAFEATVGFASTSWWSANPQQIKPEAIEYLNKYSQLPGAPYESAQEISEYLSQSQGSLPASMIVNVLNAYLYDGNLMKSAMLVEGKWVALQPLFDNAYNAYTTEHDKIDSYASAYLSLQSSNQITMPPGSYPFSY